MFSYRRRTTQSVRRNNEIVQALTSLLLLFSSTKTMNAVCLFHRMPSIYPVHHCHRSSLLTCRFVTDDAASRRSLSAYETLRVCKCNNQNEMK
ncbi:hypothetical protein BGY98DRAFT_967728 [Russula aff. rugulosa BPL654]|nr:hypothetical protein BGY98DRAFT_967728 [Russula aff. rugulosa BPL654]